MPRYQVSEAGLQLIMSFEGYRASAAQLPDGRWTIGYGHTKSARAGAKVSPADARILLLYDLSEINLAMQALIFTPLSQNQVDALSSFTFNIGLESFQTSAVLQRVNEGALLQAACAIDLWRRAQLQGEDFVVDALVRRRAAEKALFLTPAAGWSPAPSPVVRPQLDLDVDGSVPKTHPLAVHAALDGDLATAEVVAETALVGLDGLESSAGSRLHGAGEAISERLQALLPETGAAAAALEIARAPEVLNTQAPSALADLAADEVIAPFPAMPIAEATVSHPTPAEDDSDLIPHTFKPVPAAVDLFLAPSTAPAIDPAPVLAPEPPSIDPEARTPSVGAQHGWINEGFRRPISFSNQEVGIEPRGDFRTPASAGFSDLGATDLKQDRREMVPLILLGLFGLIVFAGSVFWTITARASSGMVSPVVVGGVVALIGVACVVTSVYFLVHRFLGREI